MGRGGKVPSGDINEQIEKMEKELKNTDSNNITSEQKKKLKKKLKKKRQRARKNNNNNINKMALSTPEKTREMELMEKESIPIDELNRELLQVDSSINYKQTSELPLSSLDAAINHSSLSWLRPTIFSLLNFHDNVHNSKKH